MITIKNFLSKKHCKELIDWHKKFWPQLDGRLTENHYNQQIIKIHNIESPLFKFVGAKLNSEIQKISKYHYTNYYQLAKWNTKCDHPAHTDISNHVWSSILYLNDNFKGGETIVGDEIVKPETGKIIFFEGAEVEHSVTMITKGVRYTIPCWYSDINLK